MTRGPGRVRLPSFPRPAARAPALLSRFGFFDALLCPPERQELRIDSPQLLNCAAVHPSCVDKRHQYLDQAGRHVLNAFDAIDAVRQCPLWMTVATRALAGRFATASVTAHQGPPEELLRKAKTSHQGVLATPKP